MTLGEKIRQRRCELHMTMDELGNAIGVQRSAINKYEKGIITDLKRSTIQSLARALDISPLYLLDDGPVDLSDLSETESAIISAYRIADDSTRSAVRAVLHVPDERKTPASSAG